MLYTADKQQLFPGLVVYYVDLTSNSEAIHSLVISNPQIEPSHFVKCLGGKVFASEKRANLFLQVVRRGRRDAHSKRFQRGVYLPSKEV